MWPAITHTHTPACHPRYDGDKQVVGSHVQAGHPENQLFPQGNKFAADEERLKQNPKTKKKKKSRSPRTVAVIGSRETIQECSSFLFLFSFSFSFSFDHPICNVVVVYICVCMPTKQTNKQKKKEEIKSVLCVLKKKQILGCCIILSKKKKKHTNNKQLFFGTTIN